MHSIQQYSQVTLLILTTNCMNEPSLFPNFIKIFQHEAQQNLLCFTVISSHFLL